MLIDTHCHFNFLPFKNRVEEAIVRAEAKGVRRFVVPGADIKSSKRAVSLAEKHPSVYAAVGIHPSSTHIGSVLAHIEALEKMLLAEKVVAVGEVGIDKHEKPTVESIEAQKKMLAAQIKLSVEFDKSLILHNCQGTDELLPLLTKYWDKKLAKRTVFHCCQADEKLLAFALARQIYVGVDGDLSWSRKKQRFIKNVPLSSLVLETDSPFLKPKQGSAWPKSVIYPPKLESEKNNHPQNIALICKLVAYFKGVSPKEVATTTTENAQRLFNF